MTDISSAYLGVSTMYITTVGKAVLSSSMMICPPALHVNDCMEGKGVGGSVSLVETRSCVQLQTDD